MLGICYNKVYKLQCSLMYRNQVVVMWLGFDGMLAACAALVVGPPVHIPACGIVFQHDG